MASIISNRLTEQMTINNYLGTLDLLSDYENRNQFIYGSQLYGTFFGVYAFFKAEIIGKHEIKINKIVFNILNYKGPIDIGIDRAEYNNQDKIIYLYVKALSDPRAQFELDLSQASLPLTLIKKGHPQFIYGKDHLTFYRRLVKIDANARNHTHNGVFDSEFYTRDGIRKIPKIRFDQLNDEEVISILDNPVNKTQLEDQGNYYLDEVNSELNNPVATMGALRAISPRCVPSVLKVLF